MGKSYQVRENVFVLPVDMENRPVEDIARDAVASIMEVCDQVGKQLRRREKPGRDLMKVISTGSEFEIFPDDLRCYDILPSGNYSIKFSEKKGFWLEKYPEFEITDVKIYGVHLSKADKVMTSFGISKRNLGVM